MFIDSWQIRKATLNDANFLLESYFQIYGIKLDSHQFYELLKKKLKSNASFIYVAENKLGNIIGSIVCEKQESFYLLKPVLQIKEFYISPKYRKLNLADDLYNHIESKANKIGIFKIEVLCNISATTTQNFYLRKKFVTDRKAYIKLI